MWYIFDSYKILFSQGLSLVGNLKSEVKALKEYLKHARLDTIKKIYNMQDYPTIVMADMTNI